MEANHEYNQFYYPNSLFDQSSTPCQDVLTSWLDQDDAYSPTMGDETVADLQMLLDDHFFQFNMLDVVANPHSLPLPSPTQHALPFPNPPSNLGDDMFLYDEMCATPEVTEPDESFGDINNINIDFFDSSMVHESTHTDRSQLSSPDEVDMNINISSPTTPQSQDETPDDAYKEATSARASSKNLVSERNRRKRLSRQLFALRALVPNISKMDKRSVLVDALAYLRSIHEEMELLKSELTTGAQHSGHQTSMVVGRLPSSSTATTTNKLELRILKIDIEKMEDKRFIVKVTSRGGHGIGGEILGIIESLGIDITYAAMEESKPGHIQMTVFIKVRKQDKMTEEKLKNYITSAAVRLGLMHGSGS